MSSTMRAEKQSSASGAPPSTPHRRKLLPITCPKAVAV